MGDTHKYRIRTNINNLTANLLLLIQYKLTSNNYGHEFLLHLLGSFFIRLQKYSKFYVITVGASLPVNCLI